MISEIWACVLFLSRVREIKEARVSCFYRVKFKVEAVKVVVL